MRLTTRLGLGLLLVGAVAILVSSGAFDSMEADRGVSLGVASDSDALLALTYPNGQNISLERSNADNYNALLQGCLGQNCDYSDREIVVVVDNTTNGALQVMGDIDFETETGPNLEITSEPSEDRSGPELTTVTASFQCEEGFFAPQKPGSGSIQMDATVTDGNVTIDASRHINVECVQG